MIKKIFIYYRISDVGYKKEKPKYINNENCLANAILRFPIDKCKWKIIADNISNKTYEMIKKVTKLNSSNIKLVSIGHGAGTFNLACNEVLDNKDINDNDILYFIENDYIHRKNSLKILKEGFATLKPAFLTLYDHPDKYISPYAGGNKHCLGGAEDTRVYLTRNSHWKITNSTTMTFACTKGTLKQTKDIIKKYTKARYPRDFDMFMELRKNKKLLISPLPSYSTHGETKWLAPLINWEREIKDD